MKEEFEEHLVQCDNRLKNFFRNNSSGLPIKWFRPVSVSPGSRETDLGSGVVVWLSVEDDVNAAYAFALLQLS